jgi:hypothetical protein
MSITGEGHFESVASYDINEQWGLIQHIDVIVGFDNLKKHACSNGYEKQQLQG